MPKGSLTALDTRAQRAAQDLALAIRQLGADKLEDVEPLLAELRTEVTPLPDLYLETRTLWEKTHRPRARRGAVSRRPSR